MNRNLAVRISRLTVLVLCIESDRPWHSNILVNAALAGLVVGGSAGLAISLMSFLPGWKSVALAATPTFCIASFLCATVIAVRTWPR